MRHIYKFAVGIVLLLHIFLTPVLVNIAYRDRGEMAFGGEYLAVPLIAFLLFIAIELINHIKIKK